MVIETGPRARSIPLPMPDKRTITFGTLGQHPVVDILNPSTDPSLNCGFFHGGLFRPDCWAQVYQQEQYGNIPRPVPPVANAPQTTTELTVPGAFTPEQAINTQEQISAPTREAIVGAELSGDYVPEGKLPNLDQYKGIIIAGAVIGGIILFSSLTRR